MMNNNLASTVVDAFIKDATNSAAALQYAMLQLEAQGVDTGLTRQSLTPTKDAAQSHAPAAEGSIFSKKAAESESTVSAIGFALLKQYPQVVELLDADTWSKHSKLVSLEAPSGPTAGKKSDTTCTALTKRNLPCENRAKAGSTFCGVHKNYVPHVPKAAKAPCQGITKAKAPCKNKVMVLMGVQGGVLTPP